MTTGAESISAHFAWILGLVNRMGAIWIAVIALYVVSGLISPGMFHVDQVLNILQVSAFLGVVATGQTLALLVGGIDVSVAGVVTMSNIVSTSIMVGHSETMLSGIGICLLIAALVGLINGWMITMLRVTPLVATLAMNSILFGAALVYTGGAPHGTVSPGFLVFGQGHLIGLPVSTLCWLAIALAMVWLTQKTVFGRRLYAVGANPVAARLVGIAVRRTVTAAYILSSVLAALGGLLRNEHIWGSRNDGRDPTGCGLRRAHAKLFEPASCHSLLPIHLDWSAHALCRSRIFNPGWSGFREAAPR